jgi:hypothetical protein
VAERPPRASDRPLDAHGTPNGPAPRTEPAAATEAPAARAPEEATAAREDHEAGDARGGGGTEEAPTDRAAASELPTAPRDGAPPIRVHTGRLERQVDPLALSPTEALRLAREGRASLIRRDLPPDVPPGGEDEDDA